MNKKTLFVVGCALCSLWGAMNCALAQSSVFTYQGELNTNGVPYSGSAEFQFTLWDAATNGNSVATNNPTSVIITVANGLFTVPLDFGINPFNGDPRFLDIQVRTVIGPFNTLTPRQQLTATPYALRALNLTTNGLVSGTYGTALNFNNAGNSFAGAFIGSGANVSNVNALTLGGVAATGFWKTNGNAGANPTNGAFVGTTDNLPLEIKVNRQIGLRLEPNVGGANVIGGSFNNMAPGVEGGAIGGGSGNTILLSTDPLQTGYSIIGGGIANLIGGTQDAGTFAFGGCNVIGGGIMNDIRIGGNFDVIAGGNGNSIGTNAEYATIVGGRINLIGNNSSDCAIAGGNDNIIGTNSPAGVIGGGDTNTITSNASFATIPGGDSNTATNHAFAAGHRAKAINQGAFVWADSQNADFASTANNQFLIRAAGGVGINTASPTRDIEVQNSGDVEIGIKSTDATGRLWTLQSSAGSGNASFQIIDRTANISRFLIATNGNVGIGTSPTNKLHVAGGITCTALVQTSDRNAKENFEPVSPSQVLAKVTALPISSWNFKEMRDGRHLGPMAQDFYAAFQLGGSDTTITAVDTEGVALAAIQGLNQKLLEESKSKDAEIQELKARLEKLEKFMASSADEIN
jgi:hypothetical protein